MLQFCSGVCYIDFVEYSTETMSMEAGISEPLISVTKELPRGLRWRGGVLWISKKLNGKRYQFSTGCKTL